MRVDSVIIYISLSILSLSSYEHRGILKMKKHRDDSYRLKINSFIVFRILSIVCVCVAFSVSYIAFFYSFQGNVPYGNVNKNDFADKNNSVIVEEKSKQDVDKYCVDREKPMVALTFDDGPFSWGTSEKIYTFLVENKIRATFFLLGRELEYQTQAIKLIEKSHSQIANHTYNHKELTKLSPADIRKEEQKVVKIFQENGLKEERYLVRVPYGEYNKKVLDNISAPIILWNKDSRDWIENTTADKIMKNIGTVKDGDIILMHDIFPQSLEALKILVPQLREQGFQFVTINELFASKNIPLERGKVYKKAN